MIQSINNIKKGPLCLYSFVNYYLSDLQRGLQTAHLVAELNHTYGSCNESESTILSRWQKSDKTIIILNGGNCASLQATANFFEDVNKGYPYGEFREDNDSLNGALTCVGIIFPLFSKEEYEFRQFLPAAGSNPFVDTMRLIGRHKLA